MENNNTSNSKCSNPLGEEAFLNQLNLSKCCKTMPKSLTKHPCTRSRSKLMKKISLNCALEKEKTKKVKLNAKISQLKTSYLNKQKLVCTKRKKLSISNMKEIFPLKIALNKDDAVSASSGFCRLCRHAYSSKKERVAHFSSSNHILLSEAKKGTNFTLLKQETAVYQDLNFPAKCPTCGEGPLMRRDFLAHHRRHSGTSPYHCIRCQALCYRRCDLLRHIRRHLGQNPRLNCPECAATFAQQSSVVSHLISKHSQPDVRVRNFKCTECNKAFLNKHDVHRHMKSHTGLAAARCPVCARCFSSKHALESHKNRHSDKFPFKCDVCSYSARSKQLLLRHQRSHRGEKPFKCDLCSYASASSSGMKRHMNKHSGVRPYKCPYCLYRSSNIENLRKHIKGTRKHKGLSVYPCRHCPFSCDSSTEYVQHIKQLHFPYIDEEKACATKLSGIYVCESDQKPSSVAVRSDSVQSNDPTSTLMLTSMSNPPAIEMSTDDKSSNERHHVVAGLNDELLGALMKIPNLQQVILTPGDGDAPVTLVIGPDHDSSGMEVDDPQCALKHDQTPPNLPPCAGSSRNLLKKSGTQSRNLSSRRE